MSQLCVINLKNNLKFKDKSAEKDESFSIELYSPLGGVKLGRVWKCVVTIINDDGKRFHLKLF
jgi:hypothetical protein